MRGWPSRGMCLCRPPPGGWSTSWSAKPAGSPSQPGLVLVAVACHVFVGRVGSTPQDWPHEGLWGGGVFVLWLYVVVQQRLTGINGLDSTSGNPSLLLVGTYHGELESRTHPCSPALGWDARSRSGKFHQIGTLICPSRPCVSDRYDHHPGCPRQCLPGQTLFALGRRCLPHRQDDVCGTCAHCDLPNIMRSPENEAPAISVPTSPEPYH